MKIGFHGAAQTVTGSQHLLQVNGYRILMECGLYQGKRKVAEQRNRSFSFDPSKLDAVILSHAHIDHSGNLPNLVKSGYRGPIYATPATSHLANIMLLDSAHIQETDAEYINEKNARKGLLPVEPLYTIADAALVAQQFYPVTYHQTFEVVPGVSAVFFDAGHILGSAAVALEIDERGPFKQRDLRLWFSGDIGRRGLPLIRDPELPDRPEVMIMECTYGDKPHNDPEMAYQELQLVVKHTLERGGKVIIPAFAVGRTQDLVYNLHQMMDASELPHVPVIVDSPLAVNASDIYKAHPECFDEETRQFVLHDRHRAALGFDGLVYTRSAEDSKALNDRKDPMIIISASGMAENGRIRHHLKNNIENPRNTILIVSWQAPDTLGRRLAEREKEVMIFGEAYDVRAEVATIGGLSSHAGQNFLLEYARSTQETARQIFLVHGEAKPAEILTQKLAEQGQRDVAFPELHSVVEI
jgi:metallo-beta-lactamase family protein